MSSRDSSSPPAPESQRKRIARACEGCRLRKTKCDGGKPCRKCKASNIICTTWTSKKPKDKVYAKGYVDSLERRQAQLIAGLEETYHRLLAAQLWPGQKLPETSGHPLVHEILEALNILEEDEEDSDAESNEHESENGDRVDRVDSRIPSESQSQRATQSPKLQASTQSSPSRKSLIRPKVETSISLTPLTPAVPEVPQSKSPVSPVKTQATDSLYRKMPTVTSRSLPSFDSTVSSSPTIADMPTWDPTGASFNNNPIMVLGTSETPSSWATSFSPEMSDLTMDMDFSMPGTSYDNPTLRQMQDQAKAGNNNHWWMANLESSFPESMSTGGMDELSNMLYHDICADTTMMDLYQQDLGHVQLEGNIEVNS